MGLDWDWPEFRPADPKAKAAEPPKVEVLLGDLTDSVLWYNRASVYANLGEHDKAVADYSKAIELKADYTDAWYERAWLYVAKGQWAKSAADFAQVCKLYPDELEHIFNYAARLLAGRRHRGLRAGSCPLARPRRQTKMLQRPGEKVLPARPDWLVAACRR